MRKRFLKRLIVAMALLLNLGGSPVSWAHLMTHEMIGPTTTLTGTVVASTEPHGEHCAEQAASTDREEPGGSKGTHRTPSCCAGGLCHCGCPPAPALTSQTDSIRFDLPLRTIEPSSPAPGAAPLGDPIRPPIV
jgi:hypothetical protein